MMQIIPHLHIKDVGYFCLIGKSLLASLFTFSLNKASCFLQIKLGWKTKESVKINNH